MVARSGLTVDSPVPVTTICGPVVADGTACPRTTEAAAANEKMTPPNMNDLRTGDLRRCRSVARSQSLCFAISRRTLLKEGSKSSGVDARATAPQVRPDDAGARSRSRDSEDPWDSHPGYEPPAQASMDERSRASA